MTQTRRGRRSEMREGNAKCTETKKQCSNLLTGFMVLLSFTTASKKQYTHKYSHSSTPNLALHNILFISPFLLSKWIRSSSLCIHQSWKPADRMTDWPHIYSVRLRDLSPCLKFKKDDGKFITGSFSASDVSSSLCNVPTFFSAT